MLFLFKINKTYNVILLQNQFVIVKWRGKESACYPAVTIKPTESEQNVFWFGEHLTSKVNTNYTLLKNNNIRFINF